MKTKTSWNRLLEASEMGTRYLREHPEKTKLEYAIQRTLPRIAKLAGEMQEELDGINAARAVTGNVGGVDNVILRTAQGGYQFTPDKQKECVAARRKFLNEPNIEMDVYLATELPRKDGALAIEIAYLDAFDGIIISSEDVASAYAEIENSLDVAASQSVGEQSVVQ